MATFSFRVLRTEFSAGQDNTDSIDPPSVASGSFVNIDHTITATPTSTNTVAKQ